MVLPALVSLKNLIKTKSYHIDLPFFRLHYQATACLLLAFCLILTANVLFGETIKCQTRMNANADIKFVDHMCYAIGTYTKYQVISHGQLPGKTNVTFKANPESRYFFTGIPIGLTNGPEIITFWHSYYQYVPLILFVQAVLFYFPHYLWKLWENGIISTICQRLHEHRFAPNEYFDVNYDLVYYIQNVLKFNKSLVYKYYFCHILCMLNLVIQIIVLNRIFNYQFVTYGYMFIKYLFDDDMYGLRPSSPDEVSKEIRQANLNNPLDFVFPKVTSCFFETASQAGKGIDKFYPMCILPLNILHDKFFLLLWFWFLILITFTALQIINDFMFTMLPLFRRYLFAKRFGSGLFSVTADDSCTRQPASLQEVFLLNLVGHNSDKFAFAALLRRLNKDDWTASPSETHSVV
uniref:Innexin n=1 Tax=Aceria tosichella TaxID=561515 RepID=A0A6G1SHX9_9ACAR